MMTQRAENVDDFFCPLSKADFADLKQKPKNYPKQPAYLFHPFIIDLYSLNPQGLPDFTSVNYNNGVASLLGLSSAFENHHVQQLEKGLQRCGADSFCVIYHRSTIHNTQELRRTYLLQNAGSMAQYDKEMLCRIIAIRFRWELGHGTEFRAGIYNQQGCPDRNCAGHFQERTEEPKTTSRARDFLNCVEMKEGGLQLLNETKVISVYPEFGNKTLRQLDCLKSFHDAVVDVVFRNSLFFNGRNKLWGTRMGEYVQDVRNKDALLKRIVVGRLGSLGNLSRTVIPYTKNGECVLLWKTASFIYEPVSIADRREDVYLPRFSHADQTEQKIAVYLADQEIEFRGSGKAYEFDWPTVDAFKTFLKGYDADDKSDSDLEPKKKRRNTATANRPIRSRTKPDYRPTYPKYFDSSEDSGLEPPPLTASNAQGKAKDLKGVALSKSMKTKQNGNHLATESDCKNELRAQILRLLLIKSSLENPGIFFNAIRCQVIESLPTTDTLRILFGGHSSLNSLLSNFNHEQLEKIAETISVANRDCNIPATALVDSKAHMKKISPEKLHPKWDAIEDNILEEHLSVENDICKIKEKLDRLILTRHAPTLGALAYLRTEEQMMSFRNGFNPVADSVWVAFLEDEETKAILQHPNPAIRDLRLKRKLAKMGNTSWSSSKPYRSLETLILDVCTILKHPDSQKLDEWLDLSDHAATIANTVYQNVLKSDPALLQADVQQYIPTLMRITLATIEDMLAENFGPEKLVKPENVRVGDGRTLPPNSKPPSFDSAKITDSFASSSNTRQNKGGNECPSAVECPLIESKMQDSISVARQSDQGAIKHDTKPALPPGASFAATTMHAMGTLRNLNLRDRHATLNLVPRANLEAVLGQMVGNANDPSCISCHDGYGKWKECISVKGRLAGACANCHYNGLNARCSLRDKKPLY